MKFKNGKEYTLEELLKVGKFDNNPKIIKGSKVIREKVKIIKESCGCCD